MTCSSGPPWRPGKRHHVGHADRARMCTTGDESGRMGRVEHEEGAHRIGDLPEWMGIDDAGIGGRAGHDERGLLGLGQVGHLVEIDHLARAVRVEAGRRHAVGHETPDLRGDRGGGAMGQVPAVIEPHGQDGGARREQRLVDGEIGIGAGVGLHVGVVGTEQGGGPGAGQFLDLVNDLVAAVVALPGVALGVLVGQHRARCGQHGRGREVLRSDELQRALLPVLLLMDESGHFGVGRQRGVQRGHEDGIPSRSRAGSRSRSASLAMRTS